MANVGVQKPRQAWYLPVAARCNDRLENSHGSPVDIHGDLAGLSSTYRGAELLAAVLLFARHTILLGSLLGTIFMAQVFALNISVTPVTPQNHRVKQLREELLRFVDSKSDGGKAEEHCSSGEQNAGGQQHISKTTRF
jgi:hypothetical protein